MRLAVFLPNWIGDVVMATPALRALRQHFAKPATIIGVLRPYVADVLSGTTWLDDQVFYHPRSKDPQLRTWALVKELRARELDAVIMLTNSLRTAALAWASGVRERIGYVRYGRGMLLTTKLYHPWRGGKYTPTPAIDAYLQLAYAAGCPPETPRMELATLPADEEAADAVWKKLGLPAGENVVVLNSGGAFGAAKHWPSEHFAQLARRVAEEDGLAILVNCGPAERQIASDIVRMAAHPRVVSLAGEHVPIGLTKACIRRSRLLITTDSGPRFFAPAFGVPVVTLFGPTHPEWSRTHYKKETCLSHEVPCGPCMKRTCPLGHHECMRNLDIGTVLQAVRAHLEASREFRAA